MVVDGSRSGSIRSASSLWPCFVRHTFFLIHGTKLEDFVSQHINTRGMAPVEAIDGKGQFPHLIQHPNPCGFSHALWFACFGEVDNHRYPPVFRPSFVYCSLDLLFYFIVALLTLDLINWPVFVLSIVLAGCHD